MNFDDMKGQGITLEHRLRDLTLPSDRELQLAPEPRHPVRAS